jgi:hypothetical protein
VTIGTVHDSHPFIRERYEVREIAKGLMEILPKHRAEIQQRLRLMLDVPPFGDLSQEMLASVTEKAN